MYKLWHSLFLVTTFHTLGHTLILIQKLQVICGILRLTKTLKHTSVEALPNYVPQHEWAVTECLCSSMTSSNKDRRLVPKYLYVESTQQHSQDFFARWWTLPICEGARFLFNNSSHQQLHWDLKAWMIKVLPEKLTPSFLLLVSNNQYMKTVQ